MLVDTRASASVIFSERLKEEDAVNRRKKIRINGIGGSIETVVSVQIQSSMGSES